MINRILVCLCLLVGLANAQWRSGGGSTFYWSLTGQAQKTDSLRIIQGTNMTITQSGNTVTFNGAAGAGSTANVRANTGWTSNGTTAQDTLATYYLINGKFQRQIWVDTDNDSVIIAPHALYPFQYKDGTTVLAVMDSSGRISAGDPTAASGYATLGSSVASLLGVGASSVTLWRGGTSTTGITLTDGFAGGMSSAANSFITNYEAGDLTFSTNNASRFVILNSGANNWNRFENSGSGANLILFTNSTTGTTIGSDGFDIGIGADEVAELTQRENLAMKFLTNNTLRMTIAAAGGVGIGATTEAQANRAKFNVLGRAANDTLAIFSNDGGGLVGDSSIVFTGNSKILIGGGSATAAGNINGAGSYISLNAGGAAYVDFLMGTLGAAGTRHFRFMTQSQGGAETGYFGFNRVNNTSTFVNPRALVDFRSSKPVADTLLIVSNDGNATLDSTFMVFVDGSGSFSGNNLYLGGHRIRSNAAGDSLIFYDGTTMIFAILSDGSTADLVAGTPPFKFFGWHRDEIIFWILTIAGLLIWIVAILAIYDKVKEIRIREHKTLPGEI